MLTREQLKQIATYDPETYPLVMRQRRMAFIEAIQPIIDQMTKIYSLTMPTIIIRPDGEIEHKYNFSPEQEEALRLANEAIEYKARCADEDPQWRNPLHTP